MKKLPALTSLVDYIRRDCKLDDCGPCDDAKKELRAVKRLIEAAELEQIARVAAVLNPRVRPVYIERCKELVRALEVVTVKRKGTKK